MTDKKTETETPAPEAPPEAETGEDGKFFATVTLDEPIMRGGQKIEKVRLRRCNSGELRGLSMLDLVKLEVDALGKLLPRITEPVLSDKDVNGMPPSDLFQFSMKLTDFLLPKAMKQESPGG